MDVRGGVVEVMEGLVSVVYEEIVVVDMVGGEEKGEGGGE